VVVETKEKMLVVEETWGMKRQVPLCRASKFEEDMVIGGDGVVL
jgi:hypothetical protein